MLISRRVAEPQRNMVKKNSEVLRESYTELVY